MKTVTIQDIYVSTILLFCENLAELGYRPKDRNDSPDMWFRYLSPSKQRKVAAKLIKIEERDIKRFYKKTVGEK